jgi:hypothetical protein
MLCCCGPVAELQGCALHAYSCSRSAALELAINHGGQLIPLLYAAVSVTRRNLKGMMLPGRTHGSKLMKLYSPSCAMATLLLNGLQTTLPALALPKANDQRIPRVPDNI